MRTLIAALLALAVSAPAHAALRQFTESEISVADRGGNHISLMHRLSAVLDREEVAPLATGYHFFLDRDGYLPSGRLVSRRQAGTGNYQAMAWSTEYVRACRGGALPLWIPEGERGDYCEFWRGKVAELLADEFEIGLFRSEQLAADPHHIMHVASYALARIGAIEFRHADIRKGTGRWFRSLLIVYDAVAANNGTVCMSGARVKGLPCSAVGTAIYQTVHGLPRTAFKRPADWQGVGSAGFRAVYSLLAAGDTLGGATEVSAKSLYRVKLLYRMQVRRYRSRVETEVREKPRGYLHEEFATFTSVEHSRETNVGRMYKTGLLRFIRDHSIPHPASPETPLEALSSR